MKTTGSIIATPSRRQLPFPMGRADMIGTLRLFSLSNGWDKGYQDGSHRKHEAMKDEF
jgi:hypothetical protein